MWLAPLTAIAALVSTAQVGLERPAPRPDLSFEQRVEAQRAIEHVYWRHRTWPAENAGSKPPFEKVLSENALRSKVARYLKQSNALESVWSRSVRGGQLQAEMQRMATASRAPAILREVWDALGHDAHLIAETVARPALVERLARNAYAGDDRFHGALRRRAEAALAGGLAGKRIPLRDTGGDYHEERWVRGDGEGAFPSPLAGGGGIPVPPAEWDAALARLKGDRVLEEHDEALRVTEILAREDDVLTVGVALWLRTPFEAWWAAREAGLSTGIDEPAHAYVLVEPSQQCIPDSWQPTWTDVPDDRINHTAIWTGTEMIIWGGGLGTFAMNTGGRYDPATDTWRAVSTGVFAPFARSEHASVWTGTRMIVWGGTAGVGPLDSGATYDPTTDAWMPLPAAPVARSGHTAVWTGTEMIVWGGDEEDGCGSGGARYDPAVESWSAISVAGPSVRCGHTAVWTGDRMIVWGGWTPGIPPIPLRTGGIYDPDSNTWEETSVGLNVPTPRGYHTAVWTGTEMIVFGGSTPLMDEVPATGRSGARYDPVKDSWFPIPDEQERARHTAVWTGREMIVWGGPRAPTGYGGRYDPAANAWSPMAFRWDNTSRHTAVWTGTEMIVWGNFSGGARYAPASDSWMSVSTGSMVPQPRGRHTMVWTGAEVIVWGGWSGSSGGLASGARYYPAVDDWKPTAKPETLPARYDHSAVWTGTEMIVWGGMSWTPYDNGGARYDPAADTWTLTSTGAGVPTGRALPHAFWTGKEMLVWGGYVGRGLNTGGLYEPDSDTWRPTSTGSNVPLPGTFVAVWTGSEMIAWGTYQFRHDWPLETTGGRFDPVSNSWDPLPYEDIATVSPRFEMTAVWTGTEMIVWGGRLQNEPLATGGRYDPAKDHWTATSLDGSPPVGRYRHTAVWTGTEMVVWGGHGALGDLQSGGRFDPNGRRWVATSTGTHVPAARAGHDAVWTGTEMIVWGTEFTWTATGGAYCGLPIVDVPDSGPVPRDFGRTLDRKR